MEGLREEAHSKIRVFSWNQKLPDNIAPSESQGLLWFIIKDRLTTLLTPGDKQHKIHNIFTRVKRFDLASLSSKDSIETLARRSISDNCKFFLSETQDYLTVEVSNYLASNFFFSLENLQCPEASKIVIVIEIYRMRYYGLDQDRDRNQVFYEEDEYTENVDFDTKDIWYGLMCGLMVPISYSMEPSTIVPISYSMEPSTIDKPFGLVQVPPLGMFQLCDGDHALKDTCPICLVEFSMGIDIRKTPCSHIFHGACIARWLWKSPTCPMCRFQIL